MRARRSGAGRVPVLLAALATTIPAEGATLAAANGRCAPGAGAMNRVDLFFGARDVAPRAWATFLRRVVTPRFPDGLTAFEAHGQWRGPGGGLAAERTRVVVIYYRPDRGSDARIDAVRAAYRSRFRQASVLRADSTACVSF